MPTNAGVTTSVDVNQVHANRAIQQTDRIWELVFNEWSSTKAGIGAIWSHTTVDGDDNTVEDTATIADVLRKMGDKAEAAFDDSNKTIAFLLQGTPTQQGRVLAELAKYGLWDLVNNVALNRVTFGSGAVTHLDSLDITGL